MGRSRSVNTVASIRLYDTQRFSTPLIGEIVEVVSETLRGKKVSRLKRLSKAMRGPRLPMTVRMSGAVLTIMLDIG